MKNSLRKDTTIAKKKTMEKEAKEIAIIYEWIQHIEDIIKSQTFKVSDKKYNRTIIGWIFTVIHEVVMRRPKPDSKKYDGNLWLGMFVGSIFLAWYFRTHLAKIYDPRRPLKERKNAKKSLEIIKRRIVIFMSMEPNDFDKDIFKQKWEKLE